MVDETEIFKGNENTLIMKQSYTHEFQCIYHLERYPFDTQVKMAKLIILIPQKCSIEMNVLSVNQKSVTLLPSILKMNQTLDMMFFVITEYELTNSTSAHGGIKMTIRMRRKILSEMMTTYFPSLLLMMITYATTHFKPFFFEAALSENLTTMLVMTTIFISKMESLPNTSDIKMIDLWLILCQLVPFAQVVLLTGMEYLREDKQIKVKQKRAKRKRQRKRKKKIKTQKDDKQEKNSDKMLAENNTEGDLQVFIDKEEKGIGQDLPLEAWTRDEPKGIKSGLVTKLAVIGRGSSLMQI